MAGITDPAMMWCFWSICSMSAIITLNMAPNRNPTVPSIMYMNQLSSNIRNGTSATAKIKFPMIAMTSPIQYIIGCAPLL